jgi:hypothetical protein
VTLELRLQKLESVAAAHAEENEPSLPWLSAAPEPVQSYVAALVDEYWSQIDEGNDEDFAVQWLLERHPLYRPVQSFLIMAARVGERPSLRRVQAHVLYIAGKRLPFYPWPDPRGQRWRLIKRDSTTHLCARSAFATSEERASYEVEAWRKSGRTDADVLAVAGIGALELELLAADG